MLRRPVVLACAVGLVLAVTGGGAQAASAPGVRDAGGWVGSWEAAPESDPGHSFADISIRNVVHLSLGGPAVRVRLSNEFGTGPLHVGRVTVARPADGASSAAAAPGTLREVHFGGQRTVTVPAGADLRSDPVRLLVPAQANLLVTLYLVDQSGPVTYHSLAVQTSYTSPSGDHAADIAGTAYTNTVSSWYYLTGVDVLDPAAAGSVIALGDSITDGYQSTPGTNRRWPDVLGARLATLPAQRRLAVQNAGISGNRLLLPGANLSFGPAALDRLDEDVFSRGGARTVVLLEGINDIQQTPHQTDPATIDAALRAIADRAHRRGLRVLAGTITPWEGWSSYDPALEAVRLAVNAFIRTSRAFDAVVDFDAAIRDPADPHRLLPADDCGDHLHPNDAGYRLMGDLVDLRQL